MATESQNKARNKRRTRSRTQKRAALAASVDPSSQTSGSQTSDQDTKRKREIRVPIPGKRNVLVTSALPYVSNVPHLGNIIGCILSADVYARYCRRRGYNVIYMCGTDDYGSATETKALEEGLTTQEICDKYHAIHKEIYEWFDIDFDNFGRTSTPQQTEICQAIFKKLLNNGHLSEDVMRQPYCDTDERFLADRFIEGTCPMLDCGYEDAQGDQCDHCNKLLNAVDLINPRCKVCWTAPRIRDTEHMFLDLPQLKDKLKEYVASTSVVGGWSQNSVQTTLAWIGDGVKPLCITRDLKWGVPVPLEKYKDKVFYVWYDAPIGYISITANYTHDWQKWWKSPKDVELVQFMEKDNVPFHTVNFPCTLVGTDEPWTLMKTISVTEYLNYESGKFSKSRGVGVFGNDVKSTNVPVEVWRYYLLTNRPEVSDTTFTWADLQAKQNNELLKNLGNFVHGVLSFLVKPAGQGYGGVIPEITSPELHEPTATFGTNVGELVNEYVEVMEKVKLKQGLKIAMNISSLGNLYLQENKLSKLYTEDPPACAIVLKTSVGLVHLLATLLEPFMPLFSFKVLQQLNLPPETLSICDENEALDKACKPWKLIRANHHIGVPFRIFSKLKDDEVERYRSQFAGTQADRPAAVSTNPATPPSSQGDMKAQERMKTPVQKLLTSLREVMEANNEAECFTRTLRLMGEYNHPAHHDPGFPEFTLSLLFEVAEEVIDGKHQLKNLRRELKVTCSKLEDFEFHQRVKDLLSQWQGELKIELVSHLYRQHRDTGGEDWASPLLIKQGLNSELEEQKIKDEERFWSIRQAQIDGTPKKLKAKWNKWKQTYHRELSKALTHFTLTEVIWDFCVALKDERNTLSLPLVRNFDQSIAYF